MNGGSGSHVSVFAAVSVLAPLFWYADTTFSLDFRDAVVLEDVNGR